MPVGKLTVFWPVDMNPDASRLVANGLRPVGILTGLQPVEILTGLLPVGMYPGGTSHLADMEKVSSSASTACRL